MKTQPVRTRTPRMRYALDQPAGIVDEIREEHGRAARCPACRTTGCVDLRVLAGPGPDPAGTNSRRAWRSFHTVIKW